MNCLNCGAVVKQTQGKRTKSYCDANCRQKHWLKNNKKKAARGPGRPKGTIKQAQRQSAVSSPVNEEKVEDVTIPKPPESELDKMLREVEQEILNKRKK